MMKTEERCNVFSVQFYSRLVFYSYHNQLINTVRNSNLYCTRVKETVLSSFHFFSHHRPLNGRCEKNVAFERTYFEVLKVSL